MDIQRTPKIFAVNRLSPTLLLALFFLCLVFASSPATAEFPEGHRGWLVLERHNRGNVEIVTVLDSLPAEDIRINYPQLLSVTWGYKPLRNGLPTEQEIARGRLLYAAFDRIFGQDGYYAISRTGSGGRSIHYYVRNFQSHSAALKEYLDSLSPISVKVSLSDEPRWNSVSDILNSVER
jgi:hypothetical protein